MLGAAHAAPKGRSSTGLAPFRVRPNVALNNPEQSNVRQCIFRELRKIPEVIVVQDSNQPNRFELNVEIIESQTNSGLKFGYAAAVTVESPINREWLKTVLREGVDKDNIALALSMAVFSDKEYVIVDPDLMSLCRRVVADFDTGQVEPMRQAAQKSH
jgi:hypothetical protein